MATEVTGVMSRVPEGYYTRAQVADLIGRSRDTVKRWHENGRYPAKTYMRVGALTIWLYSEDDITALREVVRTIKPGGPMHREKAS